jgi:hypothetical protein
VRIARVTEDLPPFGARAETLIQYWFFYPYDEWIAPVAGGQLVQRHAGDWEAVTIGLGESEPLFAAFSQHCGGRWWFWKDVVVSEDSRPRTHPLVGVAVGSHANYQRAETARAPDWSTCKGISGEAVELLTYTWNIRDRTDNDWELLPGELVPVSPNTWPMTFPGTWGEEDITEFKGLATKRLSTGKGPRTPTGQPLWKEPMRRIFCHPAWRGPKRSRCPPRGPV